MMIVTWPKLPIPLNMNVEPIKEMLRMLTIPLAENSTKLKILTIYPTQLTTAIFVHYHA